jgi:hypothetical protein
MAASSNKHPELPHYSFCVKPYVFRVKEFIEMVTYVVEGVIDNKNPRWSLSQRKTAELILSTL